MQAEVKSILAEAVAQLAGRSATPDLDARVLLQHCLHKDRAWLISHADDAVDGRLYGLYTEQVERRRRGEPIAYITGWREFWSLSLAVNNAVLIPRPETEHLVEQALTLIPPGAPWRIADLGTGSGAVALAIARERPKSRITATDISQAALQVAAANASRLRVGNIDFRHGDWFDALAGRRFDLIASNPPYVADHDRHLDATELRFEPGLALRAGDDGLDALAIIANGAREYLSGPGWLLVEHGYDQSGPMERLLRDNAFDRISCHTDYAGHPRITAGRASTEA